MDREAWRAAVHVVAKSWTQRRDWTELNWEERKHSHNRLGTMLQDGDFFSNRWCLSQPQTNDCSYSGLISEQEKRMFSCLFPLSYSWQAKVVMSPYLLLWHLTAKLYKWSERHSGWCNPASYYFLLILLSGYYRPSAFLSTARLEKKNALCPCPDRALDSPTCMDVVDTTSQDRCDSVPTGIGT